MNKKLLLGALIGAGMSMLNKKMRQRPQTAPGAQVSRPDFSRVPPPTGGVPEGGDSGDIFGRAGQAGGRGANPGAAATPAGGTPGGDIFGGALPSGVGAGAGAGALIGIARQIFQQMQQQGGATAGTTSGGANLNDVLGQIFGRMNGKFGQQGPMSPKGDTGAWQQAGQRGGLFGFADDGSGERGEDQADIMLRAMVAAAQADGRIDESEQRNILESLREHLDEAGLEEVRQLLATPVDMDQVVARVKDPATAFDVFLVSAMTINEENPREKAYMDQLAEELGISEQAAHIIEEQLPRAA